MPDTVIFLCTIYPSWFTLYWYMCNVTERVPSRLSISFITKKIIVCICLYLLIGYTVNRKLRTIYNVTRQFFFLQWLLWFSQRLYIHRPAALSAICLSWLGRIWNLCEGGLFRTQQARFCTANDLSTESTALAGLLCTQQTTSTKISIFSQHFLSRSYFSLDCRETVVVYSPVYPVYIVPCIHNRSPPCQ